MVKTLTMTVCGCVMLALGLLGILIPILPGFLFLLLAAACFATVSPALKRRLRHYPRMSQFFKRMEAGESLAIVSQLKLAFWASLEAINPRRKTNWQNKNNHRS